MAVTNDYLGTSLLSLSEPRHPLVIILFFSGIFFPFTRLSSTVYTVHRHSDIV